jgi:ADP-ribosylglycohydrolase
MDSPSENILSNLLKKRLKTLGYPSLRKFHADRPGMGLSYEILRQVVYGGHVPRPETLFRILGAMQFSSGQIQKICGMHYGDYLPIPPASPQKGLSGSAGPAAEDAGGGRGDRVRQDAEAQGPPGLEEPAETLSRLRVALPQIPLPGNEDFWEMVQAMARVAEQKVRRGARAAEQPFLFAGEPEAIYQFLVRKGRIPPFLSRGENLSLGFVEGIRYKDRFRGVLLGAAAGEALGTITQGLTPRDIQELYGDVADLPGIPSPRIAPAVPESSPLLAVARSFLPEGLLDPEKTAMALARSVRREDAAGFLGFARNLLDRGLPWHDAGEGAPESAPAVIALPLALLRAANFRRLKLESGILSAFSHPHPAAIAGTVALVCAVARTLHTPAGSLDALSFPRALSPTVAGIEPERSAKPRVGRSPSGVGRKLGAELSALLLRRAPVHEMREALGNGPAAYEGIPFALGCFLRSPEDFVEAVLPAVGQGGDARGTAALAGALCGGYVGATGIPDRFLARLPFRDELTEAADALLVLARGEG